MYVVVFSVPHGFHLSAISRSKFAHLKEMELREETSAAGKQRYLHSHWASETAYQNESAAFLADLATALGQPGTAPGPSASAQVVAVARRSNAWYAAASAIVGGAIAAAGVLAWARGLTADYDALKARVDEMTSDIVLHFVPPRDVKQVSDADFTVPVEVHNFSKHNEPEVVFAKGCLLKDRIKTDLKPPDVPRFPKIAPGEAKTLDIACPRLDPGLYELSFELNASTPFRSRAATFTLSVQVWAPWTQQRLVKEKSRTGDHFRESVWEVRPGRDYKNLEFMAMAQGHPGVKFRAVDFEGGVVEKPMEATTKGAEVAWIRWQVPALKAFEPVKFSMILVSETKRSPQDWEKVERCIKLTKGPARTR